MTQPYLNKGLPQPIASPDGLDRPFWEGLTQEKILLQRCRSCGKWQWGPEWLCHHCLSEDVFFEEVLGNGLIYSYERVWHPVHPALTEQGPYLVVLVELPAADNVRVVGNLLGDPRQTVDIGGEVQPVFQHHNETDSIFTLLQWQSF